MDLRFAGCRCRWRCLPAALWRRGLLPIKALPQVLNPDKGYWNTSNNYLIPQGWP